jgi:hypothetical protein
MPGDDEEARKARARQLREEIASLKSPKNKADEEKPGQENPRAFIDRKVQESNDRAESSPPAMRPPTDGCEGEEK